MQDNIFTVGDSTNHGVINSFEIIGNDMYANCSRGKFNLREIEKERVPLFTTEDGKNMFMDSDQFVVDITTWEVMPDHVRCMPVPSWFESYKCFSTEDKAKEYVLMNKPCLSLREVEQWLCNHLQNGTATYQLKPLVLQKINNV